MPRIYFSLLFILLFHFTAFAQEIYSVRKQGAWEFRYSPQASANRINNQIVNQLALAHKKIIEKTSFTFHYGLELSLNYNYEGRLELSMLVNPEISTGDVSIRDFNLSDLLVPGKYEFRAYIYNVFGETVLKTPVLEKQSAELMAGTVIASFSDSLWSDGNSIDIEFKSINFTETDYRLLESELNSIMNYHAAVSLSDTLDRRVRKNRVETMSPAVAFGAVVFNSKSMRLLDDAINTKTLLTPGNDPGKLFQTVSVNRFRTNELNSHLLGSAALSPNVGNAYLSIAEAYVRTLKDVLKITQSTDHQSSPFYYRLFSNCLSLSQINLTGDLLTDYAESRGYGKTDQRLLSFRILQALEIYAAELMEEGRYAEAVDVLSSGEKFAMANPRIFLPESLSERLRKARSGLTFSYTTVVQKALAKKLPDLARKYLDEAEQYAGKYNIAELQSTGLAALYQQMANQHVVKANASLARKDYRGALTEFEKAENLHKNKAGVALPSDFKPDFRKAVHGIMVELLTKAGKSIKTGKEDEAGEYIAQAVSFSEFYSDYKPDLQWIDSLKTEVAELQYSRVLQAAFEAKKDFQTAEAFDFMKQAANLRVNYRLRHSALYDTLLVKVVIPHLNALFSTGRLKLWAGEPDQALIIAAETRYLTGIFNLSENPSMNDQQLDLSTQAELLLCSRLNGELDSQVNEIDDLLSKNRFEPAELLISEARELIFSRPYCRLTTSGLNDVISRHRNAINWNRMQKEALLLIASGNLTDGIPALQQAEAVFNHYRLDTLGLMNTGLYDLALKNDDINFLKYAVDYYTARNQPDKAIVVLDRIRLSGISADLVKEQQESLGRVMALNDLAFAENPDSKTLLRIHTGGSKWYKRFSEVYLYHIQNP